MGYEGKIQSLNPVAVRLGQHTIHAPEHDTWCVVSCKYCGDKFAVGPNRIYGSRRTKDDCVKQVEDFLTKEHEDGAIHLNAYDLGE
jgi:hypothetical protein